MLIALIIVALADARRLGKAKAKAKFRQMFSNNRAVNVLSAARFFLFGVARRVVRRRPAGLPADRAGLELLAGRRLPGALGHRLRRRAGRRPALCAGAEDGGRARGPDRDLAAFVLAAFPAGIAIGLTAGATRPLVIVVGLIAFGVVFAVNSAVHSYLILAYTDGDKVAMNVGFYYMANAGIAPRRCPPS